MSDVEDSAAAMARIDAAAAALPTADAATARTAIAAVLAVVHTSPDHAVRDHAYKRLRNHRRPHLEDEVHQLLQQALGSLEDLARRPVPTPAAEPAPPPPPPPPPPAQAAPPPRESLRPAGPAPLRVTSMVPGHRYRIVTGFADYDGTWFTAGTVLTFESYSYFPYDGGYTIHFAEALMRLGENVPDNETVLCNDNQRFFAPADRG